MRRTLSLGVVPVASPADEPERHVGLHRSSDAVAAPVPIEPAVGVEGWTVALACSRRMVERLRASGRLPAPDFFVGRLPRWRADTVRAWIERGGR
jgi:hypothetical protein